MPKMKALSSLTLVLSDVTIAFALTLFLISWAPSFASLGSLGFVLLFIFIAAVVALVTVVSLSFATPNAAARRVIAAKDMAIQSMETALNGHTIVSMENPDGRIAAVNQNFVETLGYNPIEIVGKPSERLYWRREESNRDEITAIVKSGSTWRGTERLRTSNDRSITFETTVIPQFDAVGQLEKTISIRTNVSRAKAQGAREGRNATVEGLPDEVYLYDPETFDLIYANANARQRLRRGLEELSSINLLDLFTAEERQKFRRHIAPVLSGERKRALLELEHFGNPFEVLTHLDQGEDGARVLVSVVRDISDKRDAERIKLSSVATVSHELRTPLTSIKGALRLLESGVAGGLGKDAARMIKVARRNSDRLLAIVNDILVLEKLTSGQIVLQKKCIDLRSLLSDAAEANAAFAAECGVRFDVASRNEPAFVLGDHDRLIQVMSNLMSNAAKFSPDGAKITLGIEDHNDVWRVSVKDEGPGIPDDAQKTLFENFTQVAENKGKKPHEGTGLGLPICREIVSQHQGKIAFETELGKGSTFYFELEKLSTNFTSHDADRMSVA